MNRRTRSFCHCINVVVAIFAATESAPGQILINGSFETGIDPGLGTGLSAVDTSSLEGWIVQNGTIDYVGSSRWETGDGSRCLDLTGVSPGTISQTIDGFLTGQEYRVSFLMAANPEGGPASRTLQASIGSFAQTFTFDGTGFSSSAMGWSQYSFGFIATAPEMTLAFASLDAGTYGPVIDAVSLSSAPEPGSAAPLACGFAAVVLFTRKRSRHRPNY